MLQSGAMFSNVHECFVSYAIVFMFKHFYAIIIYVRGCLCDVTLRDGNLLVIVWKIARLSLFIVPLVYKRRYAAVPAFYDGLL